MKSLVFLAALVSLVSCVPSLSYYTKDIHNTEQWNDSDLSKIQFYISDDILLWRDITNGESVIDNGKIKMIDGREVEEVIIRKGTPGVYIFSPQNKQYAISFDATDDTKYLIFGPSEKVNNRYVLLAKEWGKRYGKVTYGDKLYNTASESAFAYLMVDVSKTKRTKINSEKPSGRKVN
ncbi:MAG: hypothetical protein IPN86_09415 [Saprospiraceae bacterium]|jgi:hypothetical protein|nr:hypothetical protein [Saprospiraceae bacterium]